MVPLSTWLLFCVACAALAAMPGPNLLYLVSRTLVQGRAAGFVSLAGTSSGLAFHVLAAALGLSALLATVPAAYEAVRWAGAAYLLWLAWDAVRPQAAAGAGGLFAPARLPDAAPGRLFRMGLLTSILNPKVALFILAFLPQFVDPARGHVIWQMLFLGLLFNIGGTMVNLAVALVVGWISDHLRQSAKFALYVGRFSALVMLWLAVQTLFLRRAAPA